MKHPQQFASDNYSGICPEAWSAMEEANRGHESAYGKDQWTSKAIESFKSLFQTNIDVFFAFNGTAANSLVISTLCQSYHSVICSEVAHVKTDECNAPAFFSSGAKLLSSDRSSEEHNGKLTPQIIHNLVSQRQDVHFSKPQAVTITQATEVGTVYSLEEIRAISATCKELKLKLHMDGARFANACATLRCTPAEMTWKAGVDVLCFGGTKNGMAVGEAIIFFNQQLSEDFEYRCKQTGQLASKMRYLAAPWIKMLDQNYWLKYAQHANNCAQLLFTLVQNITDIKVLFPVQANGVFLEIPEKALKNLQQKGWEFYTSIGAGGARFMCSWDTTEESVRALANDIKSSTEQFSS